MTEKILIVGAGPTGLSAALFLALRGIKARIVDAAAGPATTSRALVVNPRTLELLRESGVTARMLAAGRPLRGARLYRDWHPLTGVDIGPLHPAYPLTALSQAKSEVLLTEALASHGIHPERGINCKSHTPGADADVVELVDASGTTERVEAEIVFAADGAHSVLRKSLGLGFPGSAFPESWPLMDADLEIPLDMDHAHISFSQAGLVFILAIEPGLWRILGNMPDIRAHLPLGTAIRKILWESSFHIAHRVVDRPVKGRVAFGGDAAHIHSPVGARGMNLGIEDAYVFAACAADFLGGETSRLEDYGRLRHPVQKSVVRRIETITRVARGRPAILRGLQRFLIPAAAAFPPTANAMRRAVTGLDHPLAIR